MPVIDKAKVFDDEYNETPGFNNAMRDKDKKGWEVTAADVQGPGRFMSLGDYSGPQVGNPYDQDSMGEERAMVTYPGKKMKK